MASTGAPSLKAISGAMSCGMRSPGCADGKRMAVKPAASGIGMPPTIRPVDPQATMLEV